MCPVHAFTRQSNYKKCIQFLNVFIVTHIVSNFRSPPYIMDPADPYHNMIANLTGGNKKRLQSGAKRAFERFE